MRERWPVVRSFVFPCAWKVERLLNQVKLQSGSLRSWVSPRRLHSSPALPELQQVKLNTVLIFLFSKEWSSDREYYLATVVELKDAIMGDWQESGTGCWALHTRNWHEPCLRLMHCKSAICIWWSMKICKKKRLQVQFAIVCFSKASQLIEMSCKKART